MDLFDRFAGNDSWHTQKLLEYAGKLTDAQLDQPVQNAVEILPWREKTQTLRQLGVKTEGFGDPMEYEMKVNPWNQIVSK